MRRLTLLTVLVLSLLSTPVLGEWKWLGKSTDGDVFYVDDGIRKNGGYIYYWIMSDHITPGPYGIMSQKTYYQGDCRSFRSRGLSLISYTESMGRGTGETSQPPTPNNWEYSSPDSVGGNLLRIVCNLVK